MTINKNLRRLYLAQVGVVIMLQMATLPFWALLSLGITGAVTTYLHLKKKELRLLWFWFAYIGLVLLHVLNRMPLDFRLDVQMLLCFWLALQTWVPLTAARFRFNVLVCIGLLAVVLSRTYGILGQTLVFLDCLVLLFLVFMLAQGSQKSNARALTATLLGTTLQALPLFLALFVIIPYFVKPDRHTPQTGFSNQLDPGNISHLSQDNRVAFQVITRRGRLPGMRDLYWRGRVLRRSFGLSWREIEPVKEQILHMSTINLELDFKFYRNMSGTIFTYGHPFNFSLAKDMYQRFAGESYRFMKSPSVPFTYSMSAMNSGRYSAYDTPLPSDLLVETHIGKGVRALVADLKANSPSQRHFVDALMLWYRKKGFEYSLNPGKIPGNSLEGFLAKKRGFCEHYAAATATLLRLADIPARVVVGFHGGEPYQDALTVRTLDAHAWVEARFEGEPGWQTIDPTNVIAPARLEMGGQRFHILSAFSNILPENALDQIWIFYSFLRGNFDWFRLEADELLLLLEALIDEDSYVFELLLIFLLGALLAARRWPGKREYLKQRYLKYLRKKYGLVPANGETLLSLVKRGRNLNLPFEHEAFVLQLLQQWYQDPKKRHSFKELRRSYRSLKRL